MGEAVTPAVATVAAASEGSSVAGAGLGASGGRARLASDTPLEVFLRSDAVALHLLLAHNIRRLRDLVCLPTCEVRDWLLLPEGEAAEFLMRACGACAAPVVNALDLAAGELARPPLQTMLPSLDAALGGSIAGVFLEVAGPPGTGKTQLCHHLAAQGAATGFKVFWLDTENTFSAGRVLEILEASGGTLLVGGAATGGGAVAGQQASAANLRALALGALQRIRRRQCATLQELHSVAAELEKQSRYGGELPGIIIVDSVAAAARVGSGDSAQSRREHIIQRQAALSALAGLLKSTLAAAPGGVGAAPPGIVVTNQVMGDPSAGGSKVALGYVWHHAVNWRLVLSHLPPNDPRGLGVKEQSISGRRYLRVEKSPCAAPFCTEIGIGPAGVWEAGLV